LPVAAIVIVATHLVLGVACLWMRRANRYDLAWLVVVAPNPLLVTSAIIFSRMLLAPPSTFGSSIVGCLASTVWAAFLWLAIRWSRRTPVDAHELDFSVEFAGITNGFALMFVPFELLAS
jgi:hypothetical protein